MADTLVVAACQHDPVPGDVRANLGRAVALVERAADQGAQLAVLPELFNTGYYMFALFRQLAEPRDGPSTGVLKELARRRGVTVVAGIAERDDTDLLYNTAVIVTPRGLEGHYRKVHLWDREREMFEAGNNPPVLATSLGYLAVLVCYDLEYPEAAEQVRSLGARLLAAPAAFGNEALWVATITARARELGVPVVAANRVGLEGDTRFCGRSMVLDGEGNVLADAGHEEGIAMAEVELPEVERRSGPGRDVRFIYPEFG